MKKFLYSLIGLAVMLSSASCEQELRNAASDGDEVEATFSVALDGLQTKAYSDGTSATKLQVYVYNTKGYLANVSKLNETINLTTTVSLKLVKGENYEIVFWAQSPDCTAYTINTTDATLTVNPAGLANDETRDAFYKFYTTGLVSGPINETIELKRPFAQINVLDNIDDWKAAEDNGIVFSGSSMTVNAPTKLAFKTGVADTPADYSYTVNAITVDDPNNSNLLAVDGNQAYKYIAMNYILAGDKATSDVTFTVYRDATKDMLCETKVPSVPYQRNYRTNIIGNIFAVDGIFNIIIVPEYKDPDYNVPLDGDPQTITPNATAPLASADGYSYDADTQTGTVSTVAGNTLNFAGVVTSNSPFAPEYYSSNTAVGTIDKTTGAFTAVAAGTTVVTIHYNAVQNGVEVKSDEPLNLAAADIKFTVTVTAAVVPVTLSGIAVTTLPTKVEYPVGEAFDATGMVVTATYSDETTAPVAAYTTDAPETFATAGTVTITVTFEGKTASFDVTVSEATVEPVEKGSGTLADPYTVAGVKDYIDNGGEAAVYVKGKISAIAVNSSNVSQEFTAQYGNAQFNISVDGTTTADQFTAYRVLYLGNRKWVEGDTQIAVGDEVILYGNVVLYNTTYETASGKAYVYSLNGVSEVVAPTFSVAEGIVDAGTEVTLSTETEGASIYYTTGDGEPTTAYTGAIKIDATTTIKAIAKKTGMSDSVVATAEYTVAKEAPTGLNWTLTIDAASMVVLDNSQTSTYNKYKGNQTFIATAKDAANEEYSMSVVINVTAVMPATGENAGKLQLQAKNAILYNVTDLGAITSITVADSVALDQYINSTENPSENSTDAKGGFFKLAKTTSGAGYPTNIVVTFTK